jgi:opacity protein-like surface antigen
MKKLLLAASVAALASSAMASEGAFYVRADAGLSMLPKAKIEGNKYKGSNHVVAGLGVGTYLMDNVRAELVLANHFTAKQSFSDSTHSHSVKPKAMTLAVKGLVDVYDYGMGKVFVGAGLGLTQLEAKLSTKTNNVAEDFKAKKKNNFSFLGTVGTSFSASEGVDLELAYSYNDHGKTKDFEHNSKKHGKYHFKSHDIKAGVRFEL